MMPSLCPTKTQKKYEVQETTTAIVIVLSACLVLRLFYHAEIEDKLSLLPRELFNSLTRFLTLLSAGFYHSQWLNGIINLCFVVYASPLLETKWQSFALFKLIVSCFLY